MASKKLSALSSLAGGQVPTDLAYVVDVSAGTAGSKSSTLDDLFAEVTKNITDGAVRFAGFAAPTVSAAGKGALYFSTADNTFKGSRNAGAFENLLFGSGGNTRVAVWNTGADQLTGYAEFVYQATGSGVGNKVVRITVSGSGQDAQFYTDNTFASTPSSAGLTNLGALNLTRLTTGSFPIITLNQGRSGPAFAQSLDVLGVARWRSTNNTTFNEAAYIQTVASQNHSSVAAGSGMEIWVTAPSGTTATRRVMIGVGPVGQTTVFNADSANTVATDFGTNTRFAIRTPTTNDNNAIAIISGASSTTLKQLVLQAGVSQTSNIFECQSSAGSVLYSISAAGAVSFGGAQVITVSSANAFAVGPNGTTNATLNVVTNVASAATGLSITGNAAGSGVTLTALSSGTDESILLAPKGTGSVSASSSAITSGNLVSIAASGTTAASNTKTALSVATSGANATSTQTTYGAQISNTSTGTSSTNVGLAVGASGGTSNAGLRVVSGTTAQTAQVYTTFTDESNYERFEVFVSPSSFGTNATVLRTRSAGTGTSRRLVLDSAATLMQFAINGTGQFTIENSTFRGDGSGKGLGDSLNFFGNSYFTTVFLGATDTILRRAAAANLALGAIDSGAATAQAISVQSSTGTNVAGANWTFKASAGTGTGIGGDFIWQVAPAGSSGTSQNAFVEAFRISGAGAMIYPATNTAGGTTGDQTINKVSGSVNFAAAATTLTITNSLVTANSLVFVTVLTNDATAIIKNVVPTAGSFTITLNAAATAETRVAFFVINQ